MTADYSYRAFINAGRAEVWDAITSPATTQLFFYGTRVECDWKAGSSMQYFYGDTDQMAADGEIVSIDAPNRYECLFHAKWDADLDAEGPVRETWTLNEVNGMVELTVELFDSPVDSKTYADFATGFPYIVSGLKSVVETGMALPQPY